MRSRDAGADDFPVEPRAWSQCVHVSLPDVHIQISNSDTEIERFIRSFQVVLTGRWPDLVPATLFPPNSRSRLFRETWGQRHISFLDSTP